MRDSAVTCFHSACRPLWRVLQSLNAAANQMESIMQELTAAVAGLDPAGK